MISNVSRVGHWLHPCLPRQREMLGIVYRAVRFICYLLLIYLCLVSGAWLMFCGVTEALTAPPPEMIATGRDVFQSLEAFFRSRLLELVLIVGLGLQWAASPDLQAYKTERGRARLQDR
jgi:hypothetical protein